ncbi:hypothetical protein TREES_T100005059 [Tupaia chinensis]|uniref:Uncharacterized protein n=1 Tax=Tupaia chinensis TaxID=246437 RepID=L9L2C9_TUPCH|nr:hypothetical protein TREES_T100005059 [Tupaia chinensis]
MKASAFLQSGSPEDQFSPLGKAFQAAALPENGNAQRMTFVLARALHPQAVIVSIQKVLEIGRWTPGGEVCVDNSSAVSTLVGVVRPTP